MSAPYVLALNDSLERIVTCQIPNVDKELSLE